MNNCVFLKKKQKKYLKSFYCAKMLKEIINYDECRKCDLKLILKRNKPIKKVSNKRITVTEETYNKVMQRDKYKCRLLDCTCYGNLELHHIVYIY